MDAPVSCVAKLKSKAKKKNTRRVGQAQPRCRGSLLPVPRLVGERTWERGWGTLLDCKVIHKIWTLLLAGMAGVKRGGEKGSGEKKHWIFLPFHSCTCLPLLSPPLLLLASATRATMLCTPTRARSLNGRLTLIRDQSFVPFLYNFLPSYALVGVTFCVIITLSLSKGWIVFFKLEFMFLDKIVVPKIWLNLGLNLTIFRETVSVSILISAKS